MFINPSPKLRCIIQGRKKKQTTYLLLLFRFRWNEFAKLFFQGDNSLEFLEPFSHQQIVMTSINMDKQIHINIT